MDYHSAMKKAVKMREEGYSYRLIREEIPVSKSTLSLWLRKIPFTPNKKVLENIDAAQLKSAMFKSRKRVESIKLAGKMAKKDIGGLSDRDLFMIGLGLYLGEGTKTHEHVRMINADPQVIKLMIRWFHKICKVPMKNFRIKLHIYPDNDLDEAVRFWVKATGIQSKHFGKIQIDRREKKQVAKRGKLPHGTVHLVILSCGNQELGVFLHRRIMAWIKEIL